MEAENTSFDRYEAQVGRRVTVQTREDGGD
jgi:hypothetical protein